jgi:8-oxo-dGTP pyrophosphatase MutT (NUDIX family)
MKVSTSWLVIQVSASSPSPKSFWSASCFLVRNRCAVGQAADLEDVLGALGQLAIDAEVLLEHRRDVELRLVRVRHLEIAVGCELVDHLGGDGVDFARVQFHGRQHCTSQDTLSQGRGRPYSRRRMTVRARKLVVAGLVVADDGRVLITRRKDDQPMGGFWEFPGGKLEPGEAPTAGLARELREELGVEVEVGRDLGRAAPRVPRVRSADDRVRVPAGARRGRRAPSRSPTWPGAARPSWAATTCCPPTRRSSTAWSPKAHRGFDPVARGCLQSRRWKAAPRSPKMCCARKLASSSPT